VGVALDWIQNRDSFSNLAARRRKDVEKMGEGA
jgi:hypothetical protein